MNRSIMKLDASGNDLGEKGLPILFQAIQDHISNYTHINVSDNNLDDKVERVRIFQELSDTC